MLHGFSFALVIGILIGTYSSIAIAARFWSLIRIGGKAGKPPVVISGSKVKVATGKRPVASGQWGSCPVG